MTREVLLETRLAVHADLRSLIVSRRGMHHIGAAATSPRSWHGSSVAVAPLVIDAGSVDGMTSHEHSEVSAGRPQRGCASARS